MAAVLEGIQQETTIEVLPEDSHPSTDGPPQELAPTKEEGDEEEAKTPTRGVKFSIADVIEGLPSTDSDQSQSKLMAPVKPITLRIYTCLEEQVSIQFSTGKFTTAGEIVSAMVSQLNLPEETKNVFSVWMISQHLHLQLKSYHVPVKLFKKWNDFLTQYTTASYEVCSTDKPILSFRRNAFFSLREEKRLIAKKNSKEVITLLYHEARLNVISGRYPLSKEELIELASIQCAIENKEYNKEQHTPQSFKSSLSQYFPPHLVPATGGVKNKLLGKGSKSTGIENDLVTKYESIWLKVSSESKKRIDASVDVETSAVANSLGTEEEKKQWLDIDLQLKLLYLQRCWIKPYYGCVMFRGQIERKQILSLSDRNVVVAINPECIHLFTDTQPREILLYLSYDMFCWEFQPATEQGENFYSSLWLEFDSFHASQKVAKRVQVFSRQAPMMDAMISRCVDELNQFDEEVKKKRLEKGGPEYAHLAYKALPSSKNFREDVLKCDMYTPDGEQVNQISLFRKKKVSTTAAPSAANPGNEEVTGLPKS
ncbi:PREDICTED: FERM domain-containing protein 8-like isoform X2 [Amphimedon queenslandica]|uniref:FERM domain-containing protein 8 n=1 Tax=Amphimedon queenslandica TaxID=400682 RepID=A0AAN0J9B8_AMPQE|nr:PREDICTED: FERM domain-containing protein 8-like isoform X2 [Amphimedon queenslandica]|eukprot:XP_019853342.1 PREDICTED: FERM domain-containing protein 8-like isoform X2 [Amphimedon queenslandica]